MQERIADLSDHLQKLNKRQAPNQSELRKMAKSLRVPQKKDGLSVDVRTLLPNVQRAFLAEVESLRETRSNLESPAASSSGGDQPFVRGGGVSQPAASAADEFESPAVRQILQDVLEFGRLPNETKNPKTESEIAEHKLAARVRKSNIRDRAKAMLEMHRFVKCHLKVFCRLFKGLLEASKRTYQRPFKGFFEAF
jgi:hypothetical protein